MAILKLVLYHEDPTRQDRVFHALADPTRRAVVERLSLGPASVSELAAPHAMTLQGFGQHLQVLERSGLVVSEKQGRVRTCRINPDALTAQETWLATLRVTWENRLDRLGELLAESESPNQKKEN